MDCFSWNIYAPYFQVEYKNLAEIACRVKPCPLPFSRTYLTFLLHTAYLPPASHSLLPHRLTGNKCAYVVAYSKVTDRRRGHVSEQLSSRCVGSVQRADPIRRPRASDLSSVDTYPGDDWPESWVPGANSSIGGPIHLYEGSDTRGDETKSIIICQPSLLSYLSIRSRGGGGIPPHGVGFPLPSR